MNLKDLSSNALFDQLRQLGVALDPSSLVCYTKIFDTPEQLCLNLAHHVQPKAAGAFYAVMAELWNREKPPLAHFCSQLESALGQKNDIFQTLFLLKTELDALVSAGQSPLAAFKTIQALCSYDIEAFLYRTLLQEIEEGNATDAHDLLEGFYPYMQEPLWFDYLQSRLAYQEEGGTARIEEILTRAATEKNLDLLFEELSFLSSTPHTALFLKICESVLVLATITGELIELTLRLRDHAHAAGALDILPLAEGLLETLNQSPLDGFKTQTDHEFLSTLIKRFSEAEN